MLERYNKAVNSSDGIAALGADKNVDKKQIMSLFSVMAIFVLAFTLVGANTTFWFLFVWKRVDSLFRRCF
jgi:hypothetical protein